MRIEYLREFIALSRTLNLTATAKDLNITQPAISNHMKALEKEVGVALFQRNDAMKGRASKMTVAGRSFLESVEKIVGLYDQAKSEARAAAKDSSGELIFRLPRSEMAATVFSLIYEFKERYPNIAVELRSWSPIDLIEELAQGEIDCGCIGSLICEKEMYSEEFDIDIFPFEMLELFCVTDKANALNKISSLSIEDLSETEILIPANQKSLAAKYALNNIFSAYDITPCFKTVYCDSVEDFISTKIGLHAAFLLDSWWAQWSLLKARKDCIARPFEPRIALQFCFASRHNRQNKSLILFKSFVEQKFLENISKES
ncbi:MAG: LysR family transcriptional regulator [Coriobacteriales bacterium]|jgi:hypothetical protein|nr:LysR family transcriptional regulator [Coriobacteriales bacterium]